MKSESTILEGYVLGFSFEKAFEDAIKKAPAQQHGNSPEKFKLIEFYYEIGGVVGPSSHIKVEYTRV